jgi:hypothetical protein
VTAAPLRAATSAVLLAIASSPTFAQAQTDRYEILANSPMVENRPTAETAKLLKDELLFQRATQIYLWALPLINTLGMKVGSEKAFGAGYNILPVWKKRLDAKTLVTTPNSDVIYAMSYIDVGRDGPMVFEAPPGLQGILLDFWQRPIPGPSIGGHAFFGDVGLPGPDGGKGDKFLILPPGYDKPVPDGYFVYRVPIKHQQRVRVPALVLSRPARSEASGRANGKRKNLSGRRKGQCQTYAVP